MRHIIPEKYNNLYLDQAVHVLSEALRTDEGLFYSWQSAIAMTHIDSEHHHKEKTKKKYLNRSDKYAIANASAVCFLNLLLKKHG